MTYATADDLITRFGKDELVQLTDRSTPPVYAVNTAVVAAALTDAADEINGYLLAKYQLPLVSVPSVIKGCACDIARFRLYADRATEEVRQRYDAAVKRLREISAGTFKLDVAGVEPAARPGVVLINGPERVFRRGDRGAW